VETAFKVLEASITSFEPSILRETLHRAALVVVITLEHDLSPDLHVAHFVIRSNRAILSAYPELYTGYTITKAGKFSISTNVVSWTIDCVVDRSSASLGHAEAGANETFWGAKVL
jgi:hypothetical protein